MVEDGILRQLEEVRGSLENDTRPLLDPSYVGGYFAIPLIVFAYADYLGRLFTGQGREAKQEVAVEFIREFFGTTDERQQVYREKGGLYYHLYRHGLVHERQPKTLELDDGRKFYWVIGKDKNDLQGYRGLQHLRISAPFIPLSCQDLVDDALAGMDQFKERLKTDFSLRAKFEKGLNSLKQAEKESEVKNRSYMRTSDLAF